MANIIKRNKALSVLPLKSSQTIGAALAFLGFRRAIPMLHGSQGCTAFGKVFFVRHFREPIPLQTTAMDQISTVMGSLENIIDGLKTICEKSKPDLLGLCSTGLSETQGSDIVMGLKSFREQYPQFDQIPIVTVNTPDYVGCFESGFALAVKSLFQQLLPNSQTYLKNTKQINILCGSLLTPTDIETIKEMVEGFQLEAIVLPDLSDSLDGHVTDQDFSPLTIGGTSVENLQKLGESVATLVIGNSLNEAAEVLQEKTGVENYFFPHLMTLEQVDEFLITLQCLSGKTVPSKYDRQRAQLQDAMLDTHFMLGQMRVAMASEADLIIAFNDLISSMGGEIIAAVAPSNALSLKKSSLAEIKIGDLEDLEYLARRNHAEILISNSHAVQSAEKLGIPILRAGFPQYDWVGGFQRNWVGYRGIRQTLFDLANLMLTRHKGDIEPYHAIYSQKREVSYHAFGAAS
jgi:nitrogenase molybdenum-iron protein NifN